MNIQVPELIFWPKSCEIFLFHFREIKYPRKLVIIRFDSFVVRSDQLFVVSRFGQLNKLTIRYIHVISYNGLFVSKSCIKGGLLLNGLSSSSGAHCAIFYQVKNQHQTPYSRQSPLQWQVLLGPDQPVPMQGSQRWFTLHTNDLVVSYSQMGFSNNKKTVHWLADQPELSKG